MSKNSFIHPVNEVRFGTYKPQDVKPALDEALQYAQKVEKTIAAIAPKDRTYQNTIQALNDSTDKLELICGIVGHLAGVLGGPWHKIDELVSEKMAAFGARRSLNKKLYQAIVVIWDHRKELALTPAQTRLVEDYRISFERSGIALPEDAKRRLKLIKARLAKLNSMFERNATQANDKAHIVVSKVEELAGVDEDLVQTWHQAAKDKKLAGYYVQYSAPNANAIMCHCSVAKTRIKFQKMSLQRAPKNEKLIYEILALRKELATILGYNNFVDYVTERRMAKNSKNVRDFNNQLYKTFRPAMLKDAEKLRNFIRKLQDNPTYELHATDVMTGVAPYYALKMNAEKLGIDEKTIREYFALDKVVQVMFETLGTLYGLTFQQVDLPKPHKDVTVYKIYDEKKRHLSTVWCDWYARKGKRAGAWCNTFYEAERANDTVAEPHLGLVCANFPPPSKNKPSLLSIRDVETAWHEFGHFIHVTCSKTELREQSGFNTKWDFVEAPSQIMENWVWTDEVLSKMAQHYKTKEPLPKDIADKLRSSRTFWAAEVIMWTLSWSVLDQLLHTEYNATKNGPLFDYCRTIKANYFAAPIPEYDKSMCTFTHIFAGGYNGAYYSYQWAEVIEADLFSRFEKEGVLNPKTGRDYRDKVLARGDEVDPDVLVRDFLGRDATPDALLKRSGIKQ